MLQTDTDPAKRNYSKYLENWNRGMEDGFYTALKNSTSWKIKDAKRKLHSEPCSGVFEPGDNGGGPGQLRSFWKEYTTKAVESHDGGVIYGMIYKVESFK